MYSRKSSQIPLLPTEGLSINKANEQSIEMKRLSKSTKEVMLGLLASKDAVDEKISELDRSNKRWKRAQGLIGMTGIALITYGLLATHMKALPYRKYADFYELAGAIILLFVIFHRIAQSCAPTPNIKSLADDDRMRVNAAITDGKYALLNIDEGSYFHVNKYDLRKLSTDIEQLYQTIMKETSDRNMRGILLLESGVMLDDKPNLKILEYLGADIPRIAPRLLTLGAK